MFLFSYSGTIRARGKVSWVTNSMEDNLNYQEVQTYTKKRKASWPSGSMTEILNELEETTSSPCLTPLAPYLINDDSKCKVLDNIYSLEKKYKSKIILLSFIKTGHVIKNKRG